MEKPEQYDSARAEQEEKEVAEARFRAEWKRTLGGSDIGALMGVSPYTTPLALYAQKVGLEPPPAETEAMFWGRAHEPMVKAEFARRHQAFDLGHPQKVYLPEVWMRANADALVYKGQSLISGLEVKCVGARSAHRWPESGDVEGVPAEVMCQCAWYMAAYNVETWYIAALIGGNEYREYVLPRNRELERGLLAAACRFHALMESRTPPPPTPTADDARLLAKLWRGDLDVIPADDAADEAAQRLKGLREKRDALEGPIRDAENRLKMTLGEHSGIDTALGLITWKRSKPSVKTDWQGAVRVLGGHVPSALFAEALDSNRKTVDGTRRFLVPRSWASPEADSNGE